jgi:hypothetical protein
MAYIIIIIIIKIYSITYFDTQTKSEPKASCVPSGRSGQGRGREENRNWLRRSELLTQTPVLEVFDN